MYDFGTTHKKSSKVQSRLSRKIIKFFPGDRVMVDFNFYCLRFFSDCNNNNQANVAVVGVLSETRRRRYCSIKASGVLTLFLVAYDDSYYLDGIASRDNALSRLKTARLEIELRNVIFAASRRLSLVR